LARLDAGGVNLKKMETKRKLVHILLWESEKDGTKTEMKIMYSTFEKITFGAVALGVTLLILFMNSTKNSQLGSALSETDPVVSQEVATVSPEAVELEVESTVDGTTEDNGGPELRTLAGGVTETKPTAESNLIDGVTAPEHNPSLFTESLEPEHYSFDEATFPEAFAAARGMLGPGRAFKWQGMMYTTNLWYEDFLESESELKTIDWALIENYEGDTFKVAFLKARKELGVGQIFEWEGGLYTTNYFYEDTVVIANVVTVDEDNQSIVDTEQRVDRSHIKVYAADEDTQVSFDLLRGTKEGTTNEIASTGIQQQRIIVDEEE